MQQILIILEIVIPVFVLAGLGFLWVKSGIDYPIEFVTRVVMLLSLPCLIFMSLISAEISTQTFSALAMASFVAYAILTICVWGWCKLSNLDISTFMAPLIFGNTGNLGLPLAFFALGAEGLSYAVVVFAMMAILSFTFGIWLVAGQGALGRMLREPLIGATLLGAVFLWNGWGLPEVVTNTLSLLGQIAIPLMLLTLGVSMAQLKIKGLERAIWVSFLKYILCFFVAWGCAYVFGLQDKAFGVLVLQVSTPVAVTSYLLAQKYGADSEAVAALVVASTFMSIGALPLILYIIL